MKGTVFGSGPSVQIHHYGGVTRDESRKNPNEILLKLNIVNYCDSDTMPVSVKFFCNGQIV